MDLLGTLEQHFGHRTFRGGQQAVIESILAGRSALAIFPTGGGKSLCYQLPALLLDGVTLVISPLIALMKDQVETLQARGIAAARLDSTLTAEQSATVLSDMKEGRLKLLYIAPERLLNAMFMQHLKRTRISLLAIDESHCISEWGHNFRPEYLRLANVAKKLKIRPVLALTATATPEVARDIEKAFRIKKADSVLTSFHRPNLQVHVTPAPADQRLQLLTEKVRATDKQPAIVYVTLQQTSEHVATHLQKSGIQAMAYHAGLPAEHRADVQERFMRGDIAVIVATIAFGMGIDKSDIRAVFHYNLPKTLENYQQEIGRAGRDGQPSHCELLACADDLVVLQNFIYGDTPTPAALRQLLDHLLRRGDELEISLWDLSRTTDIRQLVIETVVTYLELEGILEPLGPVYTGCQYRLLQPEDRVLSGHSPERQRFLKVLFSCGKKGYKWTTLNLQETADALEVPHEKISTAFQWLNEAGDIDLRPNGLRHRYRLCKDAQLRDPALLKDRILALFSQREKNDAARLSTVLDYAEDRNCLTRHLLNYFGEKLAEDCGHCGSCIDPVKAKGKRDIPRSREPAITLEHVQSIQQLAAEGNASLRSPRAIARFLCGISSPATTRDRLTRHDLFGLLSGHPFQSVLQQTESMNFR